MKYDPELFLKDGEQPVILILQGGDEENILRHWHSEIELNYTMKGSIDRFFIEDETFKTVPGDILFVNSFEVHGVQNFRENSYEGGVLSVIIPNVFVEKYFPGIKNYQITKKKINKEAAHDKALYYKLIRIFNELTYLSSKQTEEISRLKTTVAVLEILIIFVEHFSKRIETTIDFNDEKIYEILTYLHENYTERITLTDISSEFYLSEGYLARYFKKRLGMSIFNYVDIIRCNHAIEELRSTQNSVERTAERNGFVNSKALNRTLKKYYGKTAKSYKGQYLP